MYRGYFNLKENPFTTSPDPRYFYLAPSHAESMAKCEYAIRNKSGLAVVYGDVGTGKTSILNKLRQRFAEEKFTLLAEDYFIYGDEADLQYRMKKAGWFVYYLPEAKTIHYGGRS